MSEQNMSEKIFLKICCITRRSSKLLFCLSMARHY